MPRNLSDVKEDEIEPQPCQANDSQEPPLAIEPAAPPQDHMVENPEADPIVEYIGGTPVYQKEATDFGVAFFKLLGMMTRITGLDDSPVPQGKTPNYLRVTCPSCSQVTVTMAPHTEKYCSGCGRPLPSPYSQEPAKRQSYRDEFIETEAEVIDASEYGGN